MTNFPIPNRPNPGDPTDISKILADYDAILGYLDAVTNQRRLIGEAGILLGQASNGNYMTSLRGTQFQSGQVSLEPLKWWYLDPANFTIAGKTVSLRVRLQCGYNGTSPGTTISGSLYAVTFSSAANNIIGTLGAQVAGSAASPAVAANSAAAAEAGFAFPAAGAYVPVFTAGAATAANSQVDAILQLFAEWS